MSDGICEVAFTSGSHTFTPPAGITKLDALVVGAGGAGGPTVGSCSTAYGGGGGEVIVTTLSVSGTLTLKVGAPGDVNQPYSSSANDTSITQGALATTSHGGISAGTDGCGGPGGTSGNGNSGFLGWGHPYYTVSGGGGAGGPATRGDYTSGNGGPGVVVNAIPNAGATLFRNDADCFGGGGGASGLGTTPTSESNHRNGTATCGGGDYTFAGLEDAAFTTYSQNTPRPHSGGGGGSYVKNDQSEISPAPVSLAQQGGSGYIALRFDAPTLPNTGESSTALLAAAGFAGLSVFAGASSLLFRRRRSS